MGARVVLRPKGDGEGQFEAPKPHAFLPWSRDAPMVTRRCGAK